MQKPPSVRILNVDVDRVDFAQTLALIARWVEKPHDPAVGARQICTVNPEFVMAARRDPLFARALANADLRAPDGVGILWAAALLRPPIGERVTGSDGIYRICQQAAQRGWRVYLLGAAPGVAQRAAHKLQTLYPALEVAGCDDGNPTAEEWPQIRQRLLAARPDILFVAYGHPRQDLWIDGHRAELPVKVAIGVGGAFDFVAGHKKRAPHWMRRLGIEWLYRLWLEPWRWRRMLVLPHFTLLVLGQWLKSKIHAT
ncbi:MAG: WecB/TagA/CpsF family glycosyltransferase [Caldilineaceae bacterium]